jgi:hypothetical protein
MVVAVATVTSALDQIAVTVVQRTTTAIAAVLTVESAQTTA